jgi:Polyketide cyclase / dehydrase and lipid transport
MKPASLAAIALTSLVTTVHAAVPGRAPYPVEATVTRSDGRLVAPAVSGEVHVEQRGVRILVHAQADLHADRSTIWTTLCDYDNLARFIPDMTFSRTISRLGTDTLVEEKGIVSVGPIHRSFTVYMYVDEHADESLSLSTAGGDFSLFEGRYEIVSALPYRSRLVFEATIIPVLALPDGLSKRAVQVLVQRQFDGLIREILRRQANPSDDALV